MTVQDILKLLCIALHSGPSRSSMTYDVALLHVISCTQFASWFAKFTWKSPTAHCTVHFALKVVVTREESWEAMAEWVMIDAALSDVSGIPSANFFFGFSTWSKSLARDIGFKCRLDLKGFSRNTAVFLEIRNTAVSAAMLPSDTGDVAKRNFLQYH